MAPRRTCAQNGERLEQCVICFSYFFSICLVLCLVCFVLFSIVSAFVFSVWLFFLVCLGKKTETYDLEKTILNRSHIICSDLFIIWCCDEHDFLCKDRVATPWLDRISAEWLDLKGLWTGPSSTKSSTDWNSQNCPFQQNMSNWACNSWNPSRPRLALLRTAFPAGFNHNLFTLGERFQDEVTDCNFGWCSMLTSLNTFKHLVKQIQPVAMKLKWLTVGKLRGVPLCVPMTSTQCSGCNKQPGTAWLDRLFDGNLY